MATKIGVIGVGKVGLPLALVMAKHFEVEAVDASSEIVSRIRNHSHFVERDVNKYLEQYADSFDVSIDFSRIQDCDLIFVVVGTQNEGYTSKAVKSALKESTPYLSNRDQVLVIVSTVNPTDINSEILPFLGRSQVTSKIKGICYNPAMIALGNVIDGFENPSYVLIGEVNKEAGNTLENVWRRVVPQETPIVRSSIINIETAKFALNLALVNKISFINTITEFCERTAADIDEIAKILKLDPRIAGEKMFRGGLGFGGPCFPRDVVAFKQVSEKFGASSYLCDAIQNINQEQISRSVDLIESFEKNRLSILGITYKPNTSIIEESQALEIAGALQRKGHAVTIYDPSGPDRARSKLKGVRFVDDMKKCVHESEIVFIAVPWAEFSQLEREDFNEDQIVIDAWRVLKDKKLPCKYVAYGLEWR